MDSAYDAFFEVEKRDIKTGEWQTIKKFLVDTPTKNGWFSRTNYPKWYENLRQRRIEAVEFAKSIYKLEEHDGVRVYGTESAGCTFCNTCWLNGHWYDDPKEPIQY